MEPPAAPDSPLRSDPAAGSSPPPSDTHLQSDWPDRPAGPPPKKRSALGFFKELPVLILIALGLAILIKTFLVQAFFIPSESMVPTLKIGDRVLVNKLVYRFRDPHRGEIIVFIAEHDPNEASRSFFKKIVDNITESLGVAKPPGTDFIKRVIGLPGDTLEMKNNIVTITRPDGKKLTLREPYVKNPDDQPFGPTVVPPKTYFVMGDNRPNSADSRTRLGPIKRTDIIGKAFIRVWPPQRIAFFRTPNYGEPSAAAMLIVVPIWVVRRRRRAARGRSQTASPSASRFAA